MDGKGGWVCMFFGIFLVTLMITGCAHTAAGAPESVFSLSGELMELTIDEDPLPGEVNLSDYSTGWDEGYDAIEAVVLDKDDEPVSSGTGSISGSAFSIEIRKLTAEELIPAPDLKFDEGVTISDEGAYVNVLEGLIINGSFAVKMKGALVLDDDLEPVSMDITQLHWIYADREVSITGSFDDNEITYRYDLHLDEGWNQVVFTGDADFLEEHMDITMFTGDEPDNLEWMVDVWL